MNMTGPMIGWPGTAAKGDRRSTCFAKVVSLRRFSRLVDHERAVNRPDPAVPVGAGRRG